MAVVGSIVSGVAAHGQAKSQANYAEAAGEVAQDQAAAKAAAIRERAARARGSNIAGIGASGVGMEGSFADALTDNDINSEMDAQTALWNGEIENTSQQAQAKMSRNAGNASLFGGFLGAGSQAFQGYGNWKLMQAQSGGGSSA